MSRPVPTWSTVTSRWARLSLVLLLCGMALPALATTYRHMTPSEILLAADLVFYGTVSDVVTETRAGEAWTLVTFRVDELLKGFGYDPAEGASDRDPDGEPAPLEAAPETVTLAFLGGAAAGTESLVSGAPNWRFDESFLVSAYQQEALASPLVGFRQGLWRLAAEGLAAEGLVDLDGAWLAVADDGSPVRAPTGATTSQVMRAVQGVLAGTVTAGAATGEEDQVPVDDPDNAPAAPPIVEPPDGEGNEPADQPTADPSEPLPATPEGASEGQAAVEVLYDVDDSGGPLLLSDKVALAAAAWTSAVEAAVDLTLRKVAGSQDSLRYGTEELLGPDTLSLTTVAADGVMTAYVSPAAGELTHTVLLHELGVIMGLREADTGVMATALTAPLATPTEADVAELAASSRFEPADLTRDGRVDFYDLLALAEAFGATGVNLAGDLDNNGTVDDADVEALRQRYQFGTPQQPTAAEPQADPAPAEPDAPAAP